MPPTEATQGLRVSEAELRQVIGQLCDPVQEVLDGPDVDTGLPCRPKRVGAARRSRTRAAASTVVRGGTR